MSYKISDDRSRSSTTTDPYLAGFRPSTPSGTRASRTTTPYSADSKSAMSSSMSAADYVRAVRQATGSTGRGMNLGYGGYGTEKSIAPEDPGYRSQSRVLDSPSSAATVEASYPNRSGTSLGMAYSQPRSGGVQISRSGSRISEPGRRVNSSYAPGSTTLQSPHATTRNTASSSTRMIDPQYASSTYRKPPTRTTDHCGRSAASGTATAFSNSNYDAQAQINALNQAQRNGTPFEEYWAGLELSVRSSHRHSSASRQRSRERAASKVDRDASRGGLGFQEWWDQESKKLDLLRAEKENMLNEREIERFRRSKGRKR